MVACFSFIGFSLPFNFFTSAYAQVSLDRIPAFPGADGFGRFTSGGRGGQLIKVTNLNDSGPGSLREAIETKTTRIIVFDISGTIHLQSPLRVIHPNVTVAGQTAPGDGITLANFPFELASSNIIVRYMRFRLGDRNTASYLDAMTSNFNRNIIIDHCSLSWGTDETGSFYANENFTLQWSIISEGLNKSLHTKGEHGYGGIWGGKNVSFHHNLIAHFTNRSPRFDSPDLYKDATSLQNYRGVVDFRNNAIYNWRDEASRGGEAGTINMINNYYKPGPASLRRDFFLHPLNKIENSVLVYEYGKFFLSGNVLEGNSTVTNDNWKGVSPRNGSSADLPRMILSSALPGNVYEVTHSASVAYQRILEQAGASLVRDAVDNRILKETTNGTTTFTGSNGSTNGIIDSQNDVGGWPTLKSQSALKDSDGDGIPDSWEVERGLNAFRTNDREYNLSPYYTDIEVYINSIVQHIVNASNPGAPSGVTLNSPSQNATVVPTDITFRWLAGSTAQQYNLQVSTTSDFSTGVINFNNITLYSHVISSLSPNTTYFWRVRGINNQGAGNFSSTFSFKTATNNQIPQAPVLISPIDQNSGIAVNADLTWSKVPNTNSYRIQVATDGTFNTTVYDQSGITSTSLTVPNLKPNTIHFWRVLGINTSGAGSYSQVSSFRTASFSTVPNLTYLTRPGNNTTIHPVAINFEWEAEPTAENYTIQISTSADFSSYVLNERGLFSTSFMVDNLNSNTTYFWRVRCTNRTGGSSPSSVWKITTSSFTQKPSRVHLVSPIHDSNRFSTSITFSWRIEPTAKNYRFQASTSSDFSSNVITQENIQGTSHTLSNLISNKTYFWRVQAINEVGSGPFSETRQVLSSTYRALPSMTKLVSPVDKSKVPANIIRLTWENVPSANEYRVQVSENQTFSTLVVNVGLLEGTSFNLPQLKENTTYFWRVRTKNPLGDGERSAIWSFTTSPNQLIPNQPVLVSPINQTSGLSSTVKLDWDLAELAESYELEVSEQSGFNSLTHSIKNLKSIYHILTGLKSNTTYYWRVRAIRNGIASANSQAWMFTTTGATEVVTSSSSGTSSSSTSLIGFWKMEENGGKNLKDHSGHNNEATMNSTDGLNWTTGMNGFGINLDASINLYGSIPHKKLLNVTDKVTIAAWIRPTAYANKQIISKGTTDGYEFSITQEGLVEFRFNRESNGSTYRLRSNSKYPIDGKTWIHVAATFDGLKSNIYINGKLDASATYSAVTIIENSGELQIGARKGNNRWHGGLDEIMLYNRVLSAVDIEKMVFSISIRTIEEGSGAENSSSQNPTIEKKVVPSSLFGEAQEAKLFPNPAQRTINIQYPTVMEGDTWLTLTDLAGKEISKSLIPGNSDLISYDLPVEKMQDGIYLVHVKSDYFYKIFRLIKN
jgi:hypothetical protein